MQRFSLSLSSSSVRGWIEILAVALPFAISTYYWAIDQHIVFVMLALPALVSLTGSRKRATQIRLVNVPFVFLSLLVVWLVVSTLWSDAFLLSFSYSVLVALIAVSGVLIGLAFEIRRLISGLAVGGLFIFLHGLFSALAEGASPLVYLAPDTVAGFPDAPWGHFTNPSGLSSLVAISFLALVFSLSARISVNAIIIVLAAFLSFALFSLDILGPIFSLVGAMGTIGAIWHLRISPDPVRKFLSVLYPLVGLFIGLVFWLFRESLLRPLGEGPDLSGRIIVWRWYFEAFLWAPLLGTGWGSSRGAPPLSPTKTYPTKEWFLAHNGFIDLAIMLGIVGLLLLIGTLVSLLVYGLRRAVEDSNSFRWAFIPSLIVLLTLNDLVASNLPRFMGFFLLSVMVGLSLSHQTSMPKPESVREGASN